VNTITHNSDCQTIKSTPGANSVKLAPTDTPLVSVIIPVYNSAKYIQKAIDSVLDQTYSNYEIIVVDDGSTDETRQKLQSYRDKIRYVFQENQGSATARNTGIKLAKGDLVAFLDSDDFWSMPEKLDKQVACFQGNPDLGGINTGWKIVDGAGKHIKTVQPWDKAPKLDLETWLKKKCVLTSAMMFRRSWLEKIGGFDPELRQSHDVDLILRLSLAGCKTEWLKEETVCYRQHDSNTTKDSLKQAKYLQAVLDKFFARNDLPESINQQERQIRYHTLVWIAWYQYNAGNWDDMAKFLLKSLDFSPYLRAENISHWLSSFKRFSLEQGKKFNADSLTNLSQWQKIFAISLRLKNNQSLVQTQNCHANNFAEQGDQYLRQKDFKKAIVFYKKAIEVNPTELSNYHKAIEIEPKNVDLYLQLGEALVKEGNLAKAIVFYKIAQQIQPSEQIKSKLNFIHSLRLKNESNYDNHVNLKALIQKVENIDSRVFTYCNFILTQNNFLDYRTFQKHICNVQEITLILPRIDLLIKICQQILVIEPRETKFFIVIGHSYLFKKQLSSACQAYRKASYVAPSFWQKMIMQHLIEQEKKEAALHFCTANNC
jgi:glycosyltransferase involved in cell wall biosynthesis